MGSASPISPRLVRAGIVTMDPDTSAVQSIIALQYNPDSLTRTLQTQAVAGGQDGVRVDALRLRGPAVETIKLEAELDAVDQLEFPNQNPLAVQYGIHPQLAQLEMLVNPTVETLEADDAMASAGTVALLRGVDPANKPVTQYVVIQGVDSSRFCEARGHARPRPHVQSRERRPRIRCC
jgi:hypothetical protein